MYIKLGAYFSFWGDIMNKGAIETVSKSIKYLTEGKYLENSLNFMIQVLVVILLAAILYYLVNIGNRYIEDKKRLAIKKKQIAYLTITLVGVLFFLLLVNLRGLLFNMLSPFIYAIVLAYILNPLIKKLCGRGMPRLWGVLLVYLAISIVILIFSITLIPRMTAEVRNLIELLPKYGNETFDYFYDIYLSYNKNVENLPEEFNAVKDLLRININRIQDIVINILKSVTEGLLAIFSKVIGVILIPILAFYFLKDAEEFKRSLIMLIPAKARREVLSIAKDVDKVLGGFIRGQLIVAAFVGLMTTIALMLLRVNFAVLVGLIAGLANIIPYFGPIIGIIPGVLFAIMDSPMKALWVIITFTVIQQIESAILSPKIVGESVGLHPIFVILALLIGGRFFGVVGLLAAVPAAGVLKVLGNHIIKYIVRF